MTCAPSTGGCNWWVIHKPLDCNELRNSNIAARGKDVRSQPANRKAALAVKETTVALKCAKISLDSDKHDTPTLSNESNGTVPEPEYGSELSSGPFKYVMGILIISTINSKLIRNVKYKQKMLHVNT